MAADTKLLMDFQFVGLFLLSFHQLSCTPDSRDTQSIVTLLTPRSYVLNRIMIKLEIHLK
ncbi:hypothetical protein SLEP1_g58192 [Rubroshorea leprosula]|uniref:Uncharacterized protein n=1 Tax=Rubroshorea leprosula TaxID=152421 RepID=A0AAV5MRB9_9ROSI|nr:hypothetical protein SLEP1_g58192 [Rubroshorea leprosula]